MRDDPNRDSGPRSEPIDLCRRTLLHGALAAAPVSRRERRCGGRREQQHGRQTNPIDSIPDSRHGPSGHAPPFDNSIQSGFQQVSGSRPLALENGLSPPGFSSETSSAMGRVGWCLRWGVQVVSGAAILGLGVSAVLAQVGGPPNVPAVTVRGQTYTPRSILARNMGTEEDQTTAFPPHKVIGNVYYVGTRTLSAFLITTPAGHVLINSTYERNVRTIEKSIAQLGFTFADVRIVLETHAHGDHQEGDALVKKLTGAQVMVMQEDVPALEMITPGGKAHPIDRRLRDGDEVTLGGTTLVAHLTAGHTRGCTTWTMKAQEGGKSFDVVFACSYRAPANVTPAIEGEFNRTFKIIRTLPCDVPLGDHPAQFNMAAKHARLKAGRPSPFVDSANCWVEAEIQEAMLRAQLQMQQQ
jgi:metallo-beta-lactamase class B